MARHRRGVNQLPMACKVCQVTFIRRNPQSRALTCSSECSGKLEASRKRLHYPRLLEQRRIARVVTPPHKSPADRLCLGCQRMFESMWIGNRMCRLCKDTL